MSYALRTRDPEPLHPYWIALCVIVLWIVGICIHSASQPKPVRHVELTRVPCKCPCQPSCNCCTCTHNVPVEKTP